VNHILLFLLICILIR